MQMNWTFLVLFCFYLFVCGFFWCFSLFVLFCLFGFFLTFFFNKCLIKLHTFEWFLLSEYTYLFQGNLFFKDAASALYDSIINLLYDWHVNGLGTVYIVANPFIYLFPLKPWNSYSMTTAGNENIQYNLLKVHGSPLL